MTLKYALARDYYALGKLFRDQLAIPDAPCAIIADELRSFSELQGDRALNDKEQLTLFNLLHYADTTIRLIREGAGKDWTKDMRGVAILPVKRPSSSLITLASPDDHVLAIADLTRHFRSLFAGALSFVALSAIKLDLIGDLLAHLGLNSRRVDRLVDSTVQLDDVLLEENEMPLDVGALAALETEEYMSRIAFVMRVHVRGSVASARRLLQSISVYEVNTIVVTYTLRVNIADIQPISAPTTCWSYLDGFGRLKIYVASASNSSSKNSRHSAVVDAMVRALGLRDIDRMALTTIFRFDDADEIDELLTGSGYPPLEADSLQLNKGEVAVGTAHSRSTAVYAPALQSDALHTDTRAETGVAISSPAPAPTAQNVAARNSIGAYVESIHGREEIDHVKAAAMRTSLPCATRLDCPDTAVMHLPEPTTPPISTDAALAQEDGSVGLSGIVMRVLQRGGSRGQSFEDIRTKEIGFLGEQFVYELLRHHLSNCATPFTYENWTSSFRSLAGFPAFVGDEVADFTYHDTDGTLTRHLFPSDHEYFSGSPRYFIEVKSTSGEQSNPFFMKKRQFLEAFRMTRSNQDEDAPLRLYVLFRVSNIGGRGTPVLRPYVDPHDMLSRGTLRIESDSVQVRIVGE